MPYRLTDDEHARPPPGEPSIAPPARDPRLPPDARDRGGGAGHARDRRPGARHVVQLGRRDPPGGADRRRRLRAEVLAGPLPSGRGRAAARAVRAPFGALKLAPPMVVGVNAPDPVSRAFR